MLASAILLGGLTTACARHLSPRIQRAHSAVAISIVPPAYEWAARAAHVPASILFAVAREESGVAIRGRWIPWPWTLNVGGVSHRFTSQREACAALGRALRKSPSGPIDVGLGQIDLGYYGDRVAAPCDLLNPYLNLLLAARILRGFHRGGEGWMTAVGRYHRPAGGAPAAQYRREVAEQLAQVLKNAREATLPEMGLP